MKIRQLLGIGLAATLSICAGVAFGNGNPTNGRAGVMPALYDDQPFLINFKLMPPGGTAATVAHNGSINTIYMSDNCTPPGQTMFIAVLDAIQGDGFNPLWQEVQVVFDQGFPCMQFGSDNDIIAAAMAVPPMISLHPTGELYRCAVVGAK